MFKKLMTTSNDVLPLILRLTLGIVMFPHGAQKLLGWWGGYGWTGTMGFFGKVGIPAAFGALAIIAEFFGALGLVTGLFTRVAAFGIACNIAVAALMVHRPNGFFMNWTGQQKGEGFEYHLLTLGIALALMVAGGGRWSADRAVTANRA